MAYLLGTLRARAFQDRRRARRESDEATLTGEMGQALAYNRLALSKNAEDVYPIAGR
jgi:hypothetical protein